MPYRDGIEHDPRVDDARRRYIVAEHAAVARVERRWHAEVERAIGAVDSARQRVEVATRGGGGWFWRPDPRETDDALRELDAARAMVGMVEEARSLVLARASRLADLSSHGAGSTAHDREVDELAVAACALAAIADGREVRERVAEAAALATEAHRHEMVQALSGQERPNIALPLAHRALLIARCRVELLRASLSVLGAAMERHVAELDAVLDKLVAAGNGPGQAWRDQVTAAAGQLDALMRALDRR